jgi:hypothetical protein
MRFNATQHWCVPAFTVALLLATRIPVRGKTLYQDILNCGHLGCPLACLWPSQNYLVQESSYRLRPVVRPNKARDEDVRITFIKINDHL